MTWSDFTAFRIHLPEFKFREWKNFTANLEFMSQVSSEIDNLQEKYAKAKSCHRKLTYDYLTQENARYIAEQFNLPINLLDCVDTETLIQNWPSYFAFSFIDSYCPLEQVDFKKVSCGATK